MSSLPYSPEAESRFWSKVQRGPGCWEWQGGRNWGGYGRFSVGGRETVAHRFAWMTTNGPVPSGMFVCHHCDNRRCVNPHHLFLGTAQDNMDDRDRKGRQASGSRNGAYTQPEARVRGESHGRHKLTAQQVLDIRSRLNLGVSPTLLAREFGVATTSIRLIGNRTNWGWL